MLASGFLWLSLEETLNHWFLLPVRELDHILVSVNAFYLSTCVPNYLHCGRDRARTYDLRDVNAML